MDGPLWFSTPHMFSDNSSDDTNFDEIVREHENEQEFLITLTEKHHEKGKYRNYVINKMMNSIRMNHKSKKKIGIILTISKTLTILI